MAKKNKVGIVMCFIALNWLSLMVPDWGFYAHRKINYYAVLTVPPPVNQFFKSHIGFLRDHAVDPDRRRYAVPDEGSRHFIDLDRWFEGDSFLLKREYTLDRILQGQWEWKTADSVMSLEPGLTDLGRIEFNSGELNFTIDSFALRQEIYMADAESVKLVSPFLYPDLEGQLFFVDSLIHHGIVPYYVDKLYHRLVREMMENDLSAVIRSCSDMGHYIADAHVPLHTTSNYNGQFTNQLGIHAFWESRIPELFEESYFNSLVGRAEYIENIHDFIWTIVEHSYSLVPLVLEKEREARRKVNDQNHYCYEERGNTMVRTQCPMLAREYINLMDGMVQEQWRAAIKAIGSVWYSAWIDAGQPDLWSEPALEVQDTNLMDRILDRFRITRDDKRRDLH